MNSLSLIRNHRYAEEASGCAHTYFRILKLRHRFGDYVGASRARQSMRVSVAAYRFHRSPAPLRLP
jgi:hypothetical protein